MRAMGFGRLIHMYVYGRWTNQYISALIHHISPRLNEGGKKYWRDHYHGKVLTLEQAEAIATLDHDIAHRDLGEQVIPYPMVRDLVLKASPEIAVFECACRHARESPCQPTQVCMVIGKPFVKFILRYHPESRRLTTEEAVELLRAEHERGHVHSAWFKDACLERFYAICNCCKCCCGGIEAMVKYQSPMMASSGYVARVDEALCNACGNCVEACPFEALTMNDTAAIAWEKCMGCGVCVDQCPTAGIALFRDKRKGLPLDVRAME